MNTKDLTEGTRAAIKALSTTVDTLMPEIHPQDRIKFVSAIVVMIDHYLLEADRERAANDLSTMKIGGTS